MKNFTMYQTVAQQNVLEHDWFLDILRREKVSSYLEIGSKFGGTLWRVASVLPKGSKIVSVDLPTGDKAKPHLDACIADLKRLQFDVHLFVGDSTDREIIKKVNMLHPFDCVFIDANHLLPYVTSDFKSYGPMASKIVAFHDINWKSHEGRKSKTPIDVPAFWNDLKSRHSKTNEIRLEPRDNGIGVLFK